MNVSSIVVKTLPKYLDGVLTALKESGVCEYHMHDDEGRIIVTIEGEGVSEEIEKLSIIEQLDHVISAEMMFSYSEEELNAQRDKLEFEGSEIPAWLNDTQASSKDVVYNGDLKKIFPK